MAYNAVSQADHEVASNATDSDHSRSPSPDSQHNGHFQQLPLDADHIGAGSYLQPAKSNEDSGVKSLGSMIRSMTSTSYDMVEEDDYELPADPSADQSSNSPRYVPPLKTVPQTSSTTTTAATDAHTPEPALRTPVTDQPVPLSHPTPDLQSLQGAYINNVERLERSAERMSLSSNIEDEIRRMDQEQKRRSSSASNSTHASNYDGLKTSLSSRHGSIQSSRLAQVAEHAPARFYGDSATRVPAMPYLPPPPPPAVHTEHDFVQQDYYDQELGEELERTYTAASTDTYQQARVLFNDFDGVHYVPNESNLGRRVSLTRPPLASRSEAYKEPQAGENMVYYPAPVPRMLNLPPRLSQKSDQPRGKRRSQLLGVLAAKNRKSTQVVAGQDQGDGGESSNHNQPTSVPPQLRASMFFEQPARAVDVEVTQASAVATLDNILDASTTAPVSAFTGQLDTKGFSQASRKLSSRDLTEQRKSLNSTSMIGLGHRLSDPDLKDVPLGSGHLHKETEGEAADVHEGTSLRDDNQDGLGGPDALEADGEEHNHEEPDADFTGPPNTLLAELEYRKSELKQRLRSAPETTALHSTLLQLEAVAQKQSEHRRQRPVTLAWEAPDAHPQEVDDDDDVPLGMLFPEKANAVSEVRPLGLMERRELEESEPLSRRRARLRGEPAPRSPERRPVTMYSTGAPDDQPQEDSGDEGETLAQRLKRLKEKDQPSAPADSDFANEILAEIKQVGDAEETTQEKETPPEDETLAQRRARLQKEAEAEARQNSTLKIPRYRRSMADILHARRPTTVGRQSTMGTAAPQPMPQRTLDHRMSLQQFPPNYGPMPGAGYPQYQGPAGTVPYGPGMVHPNTFYSDALLGMNHLSYAVPPKTKMVRPVNEPGQREIIDRWRQSIV
ncbi:uncharacterized protein BO87DRAFT_381251 [Aspergillus neoniger CBS 115656]|uniref:Uncharacterized protein n=1 Tax=Aspergillus neoniger (strain CBS 115656) TaxID=1448310 RepID=A0A318Y4C2_ASPNB|nr:hypothetical protein BO87DRAFT_381251 [Aspergillus neoniger CBS 115656]PYH28584.1 hypothetical protein BO87DRAFT_381251 [Aspergillus neoniger CBS 115656]